MPLGPESLDHGVRNRLAALLALGTVPVSMAIHTPRIPILFHKRCARIERIATLRAEKVAGVPLRTTGDDDLAFDGRFAALAARREHLMEVEMAEEALGFVGAVLVLETRHVVGRGVCGEVGNVFAALAGVDAGDALCELVLWLGIEGDALEVLAALVAGEAFGVEA
jgi:hypothetical protein